MYWRSILNKEENRVYLCTEEVSLIESKTGYIYELKKYPQ